MRGDANTRGAAGWFNRKRRRRTKSALQRMLAFQEDKARRFSEEGYDPTQSMRRHSLEVRRLLEKVRPIQTDARVLEVGSGAHGLIFFFGASRGIGIDPLAHHYVNLFPAWQRRVRTIAGYGETLPFANDSFEVLLSDDVLDYTEDPAQVLAEMKRVLMPSGILYLSLNISHPVWKAWSGMRETPDFHTVNISLREARRLLTAWPLRLIWESHNIRETKAAVKKRKERRWRAWVKSVFYFRARFEAIAAREEKGSEKPARGSRTLH